MVKKERIKKRNKQNNKKDNKNKEKEKQKRKMQYETRNHENLDKIFINMLEEYIFLKYPNLNKKTPSRKYFLNEILREILFFIRSGSSYRLCRSTIKRSSLNNYVNFFSKNKIFINFYNHLYNLYSEKDKEEKLSYVYTDTSFIINSNCLHKYVERNKYIKNKFSIKLSLVTDSNGIPINMQFVKGNLHDSPLIKKHFEEIKNSLDKKEEHKTKKYFMADAGYDSKENRSFLQNKGFEVLIPHNKRNGKIIRKFNEEEKKLYKNRIRIENTFSKFKLFRRVKQIYEKNIDTYIQLSYLVMARIMHSII